MAILGFEGFDTWAGASAVIERGALWNHGGGSTSVANPRFGSGRCLRCTDSDSMTFDFGSALTTYGIAFAMSDREPSDDHRFIQMGDLALYMYPSTGEIKLWRGGATLLFTSATGILDGNYHWIAFAVTHHSSTGTFQMWVDNVDITGGQMTGLNTRGTAAATLSNAAFVADNTIGPIDYDDLYWTDDLTYHGEKRCASFYPSGNGNSSQLDGSDGNSTDNYLLVDETTPDDDTTYVQSSTVNEIDTYAMGNMSDVSDVAAVYARNYVRKTDAAARESKTVLRSGGTDYLGSAKSLISTYVGDRTLYLTDPATSAAWTPSGVDAVEVGIKVSA